MLEIINEDAPNIVDDVAPGQVRRDSDGLTVLIINGESHNEVRNSVAKSPEEKFMAVFLTEDESGDCAVFDINENYGLSSGDSIRSEFPEVLDAELTFRRVK